VSVIAIAELATVERGRYVRVSGILRSVSPLESLFGEERALGYNVACSIFVGEPPSYASTALVARWSDAVLEDETGDVLVSLERSTVRAPAGVERTLHGREAIARALEALELTCEPPTQLQILERAMPDGRRVTVTGLLHDEASRADFRRSAKPRLTLRGDRRRPILISPR
jgi:hypothetical protein